MFEHAWLEKYNKSYAPYLDLNSNGFKRGLQGSVYNRAAGFRLIFEHLLTKKSSNFQIVETGSTRKPNNWKDGNSGVVFADFVSQLGGFVRSVDIDPAAVNSANSTINAEWHHATCADSVTWLSTLADLDNIDLFYLDSWDVDWSNDAASADHHLKEFLTIENFLKPGCIVTIDDNARLLDGRRTGKGRRIVEYLDSKNHRPVYDDYQIIFLF